MKNTRIVLFAALLAGCGSEQREVINMAPLPAVDISQYTDRKPQPVDPKHLFLQVQGGSWGAPTDKSAPYFIYVSLHNNHTRPIHEVWLEGDVRFKYLPGKKIPFKIRMVPLTGPMAYTQELLLPGHISEVYAAKVDIPIEFWRRDRIATIKVTSAEEFQPTAGVVMIRDLLTLMSVMPTVKYVEYLKSINHQNAKGSADINLLDYALLLGKVDLAKELQKIGYDVKRKGTYGLNAFHFAVFGGVGAIEYCRSQGVQAIPIENPYNGAGDGRTLLHLAVRASQTDIIPAILKAGVDINAKNKQGETPLHHAVMTRNLPAVKMLLKLGASKNVFDLKGRGPMGVALDADGPQYLVEVAELCGGYTETSPDGLTLLHHAVRACRFNSAAFLVRKGLSPSAKDQFGETPMSLAKAIGHQGDSQIMQQILRTGKDFKL